MPSCFEIKQTIFLSPSPIFRFKMKKTSSMISFRLNFFLCSNAENLNQNHIYSFYSNFLWQSGSKKPACAEMTLYLGRKVKLSSIRSVAALVCPKQCTHHTPSQCCSCYHLLAGFFLELIWVLALPIHILPSSDDLHKCSN